MALHRRFLHSDISVLQLSKKRFRAGIIVGILLAFAFYAAGYYLREIIRLMLADNFYHDLMILSTQEMNFFNTVNAFIGVIAGQSTCFTYWFSRPRHTYGIAGRKIDGIFNNLWPLLLASLGMIAGLVFWLGITIFWNSKYNFGLYPDFNKYFILLIIVLFLQQWLSFNRTFKRQGLKYMLISAAVVTVLSFGLSRLNFVDYKAVNKHFTDSGIYHRYRMDWPKTNYTEHYGMSHEGLWNSNIYITCAEDEPENTQPVIIANNMLAWYTENYDEYALREVPREELGSAISVWVGRHNIEAACNLKINRDIKMVFVNQLRADLYEAGIRNVRYAVLPEELEEGQTFRYYDDRTVISYHLERQVEPDELYRRSETFSNIIDVDVIGGGGSYIVNGERVERRVLADAFKPLIEADNEYVIRLHISGDDTFQQYIDVLAGASGAIADLRVRYFDEHYGDGYYFYGVVADAIAEVYPIRIFEFFK